METYHHQESSRKKKTKKNFHPVDKFDLMIPEKENNSNV
jgi:hypothetical protein